MWLDVRQSSCAWGEYVGVVKEPFDSGSALVDCAAVREKSDGWDAYIGRSVMEQRQLVEGEQIAFNLHIAASGWPQVSAPCWKHLSDGPAVQAGSTSKGAGPQYVGAQYPAAHQAGQKRKLPVSDNGLDEEAYSGDYRIDGLRPCRRPCVHWMLGS